MRNAPLPAQKMLTSGRHSLYLLKSQRNRQLCRADSGGCAGELWTSDVHHSWANPLGSVSGGRASRLEQDTLVHIVTGGVRMHHKVFAGYGVLRKYNQGRNFKDYTHAHRGKFSFQNSLLVMKLKPERTLLGFLMSVWAGRVGNKKNYPSIIG